MTERERLEAGAVAAWTTRFGTPPSVSYSPDGGVFSPDGWSWRMAQAVLHDNPIPRLGGEEDFDYAEITRHVTKAMASNVETPRERATTDITSALVSLEEVEATLTGEQLAEALEIRSRLERLRGAVEGA